MTAMSKRKNKKKNTRKKNNIISFLDRLKNKYMVTDANNFRVNYNIRRRAKLMNFGAPAFTETEKAIKTPIRTRFKNVG